MKLVSKKLIILPLFLVVLFMPVNIFAFSKSQEITSETLKHFINNLDAELVGEVEIISPDDVPEGVVPLMVDTFDELYEILVDNYNKWTSFEPYTIEVSVEEVYDEKLGAFRRKASLRSTLLL